MNQKPNEKNRLEGLGNQPEILAVWKSKRYIGARHLHLDSVSLSPGVQASGERVRNRPNMTCRSRGRKREIYSQNPTLEESVSPDELYLWLRQNPANLSLGAPTASSTKHQTP